MNHLETYLVYCDETGDDGIVKTSCNHFILTSLYMPTSSWQSNFDQIRSLRRFLKKEYGFHVSQEMHTKHFLTDKNPYRNYGWSPEIRREILIQYGKAIAQLDLSIINVIIDKNNIRTPDTYNVLENALKYSIQRIERDSQGNWNYVIITDKGRIAPMRTTARAIRVYNPIPSKFEPASTNQPIRNMLEDILEKDSSESYFIQICDFVSYFVHLYFSAVEKGNSLPGRVANLIDETFIRRMMITLKPRINLKASSTHDLGFVIYPKKNTT